jgi:hypothetical protein
MMNGKPKRYETPRSCDELVDLLMSDLRSEHIYALARMTADEFERLYTAVAEQIIEEFGLWKDNDPLLNSCLAIKPADDQDMDPARMVVKKMWQRVRETAGVVIIT